MISYYAVSHPGKRREVNEDSFFAGNKSEDVYGIKVRNSLDMSVCDGMGGEKYGDQASREAVSVLRRYCEQCEGKNGLDFAYIQEACLEANEAVCSLMRKNKARMGSTLTLIRFYGEKVVFANLGDSKIFRLRNGKMEQISVDHSVVARLITDGIITKEEAKSHPSAHQITQYLGIYPDEMIIEPYISEDTIRTGDIYLLCSDGLTDMVDECVIESVLKEKEKLNRKGKRLLEMALENGGKDNVTLALAEIVLQ